MVGKEIGGFSVYAMRGNATLVHSVDSSAQAIDLTNKNIVLNFPGDNRHAAYAEDEETVKKWKLRGKVSSFHFLFSANCAILFNGILSKPI